MTDAARALLERTSQMGIVASLPENERHPIVLAYFGGHTYREIAGLLSISETTVKRRIRSGLRRLRTEVQQPLEPA